MRFLLNFFRALSLLFIGIFNPILIVLSFIIVYQAVITLLVPIYPNIVVLVLEIILFFILLFKRIC